MKASEKRAVTEQERAFCRDKMNNAIVNLVAYFSGFNSRTSGPGSLRNSQYGAFGSMEKIKEPRPLHDKAFIQQCIRQLCDFLLTYGYGPTVSVKSLQTPSVKDFVKIFSFIYELFCPSYDLLGSKFEEEIPRIFKDLGYPFPLSKSSMYTLFTCMKENPQSFDEGQILGETEDGILQNKLFLDYSIKCYDHFMKGGDSFEEFDAEIDSKLTMEIEVLKQENAHLVVICDNQKYSTADVEKLNSEIEELKQAVNNLTKELEAEQRHLWNEELKYARGKEAIEADLTEYHKLARKLKLIPTSAENSGGLDFEIKFNPDAGPNCLLKFTTQIRAPLLDLMNNTEEEIANATHRKIGLEGSLVQVNTMEAEQNSIVKTLREEAQKLEDLCQQKAKVVVEEEEKSTKELELLEKHKNLLYNGVNEGVSEAMKELHETRCRLKYLTEQNIKIDREFNEFISQDTLKNLKEILVNYKKKMSTLYTSENIICIV
ncbi:hypothetical protein Chor_002947 [Crotalus horridus]